MSHPWKGLENSSQKGLQLVAVPLILLRHAVMNLARPTGQFFEKFSSSGGRQRVPFTTAVTFLTPVRILGRFFSSGSRQHERNVTGVSSAMKKFFFFRRQTARSTPIVVCDVSNLASPRRYTALPSQPFTINTTAACCQEAGTPKKVQSASLSL